MYCIGSRYYVPEWCRWLNADDPAYLDFLNTSCINLFAYCGNDPINSRSSNLPNGFGNITGRGINSSLPPLSKWINSATTMLDSFAAFAGVLDRSFWGMTKAGRGFSDFYYSAYGISRFDILNNVPSSVAKICKGMSIGLIALDLGFNLYNSAQQGYSFSQAAISFTLTAVKDVGIYYASSKVACMVGGYIAGSKLGALLGSWAGPVGMLIGAVAGFAVGYLIDELGDEIIESIVNLFE